MERALRCAGLDGREATCAEVTEHLVALYDRPFGAKKRGRYRISMKLMCRIFGRCRIWPEQIEEVRRGLYERGFLLVDLETYFAVVSHRTFVSYRRVNEAGIDAVTGTPGSGLSPRSSTATTG